MSMRSLNFGMFASMTKSSKSIDREFQELLLDSVRDYGLESESVKESQYFFTDQRLPLSKSNLISLPTHAYV